MSFCRGGRLWPVWNTMSRPVVSHFANAFTHIEKAKMAVRALHPVCHQADFLKNKTEKKGNRG